MFTLKQRPFLASVLVALLLSVTTLAFAPATVLAETIECADGSVHDVAESDSSNVDSLCAANGGVKPGATVQPGSAPKKQEGPRLITGEPTGKYECGEGGNTVKTVINIGCRGEGNPIEDLLFAIIRLLSVGVGIVLVGSLIVAGLQYTTSRGDPAATAKAIERMFSTAIALLVFIFAYAILNWLIPAGVLN